MDNLVRGLVGVWKSDAQKVIDELFMKPGKRKLYRFENGYGASVIMGKRGRSLAVIDWTLAREGYEVVYDTGIADSVLLGLSKKQVTRTLERIKGLERN